MKAFIVAMLVVVSGMSAAFCADFTKTERTEDYPDGKRYFTDYQRDGRIILTKMSAPDEARRKGWDRFEAFYVYYSTPIASGEYQAVPVIGVYRAGARRFKSAEFYNGNLWASANFVDVDGDGRDDILRVVEPPGRTNSGRARLIEAFILTKEGEVVPMNARALAEEVEKFAKEMNG